MGGVLLRVFLWIIIVILLILIVLWLAINVRVRHLDSRAGSFRCWIRPDSQSGWTSVVARYGVETLTCYRLISLSSKPVFRLPRRVMSVSTPLSRAADGSMVEVRVSTPDERWELAISPASYNGLVAWVESGPPVRSTI